MFDIEHLMGVAQAVLGVDAARLLGATNISRAESALAAPFDGVADQFFYEHPVQRAAVLAWHIARHRPIVAGNNPVALVMMVLCVEQYGYELRATPKEIDERLRAVAAGTENLDCFRHWVCSRAERIETVAAASGSERTPRAD